MTAISDGVLLYRQTFCFQKEVICILSGQDEENFLLDLKEGHIYGHVWSVTVQPAAWMQLLSVHIAWKHIRRCFLRQKKLNSTINSINSMQLFITLFILVCSYPRTLNVFKRAQFNSLILWQQPDYKIFIKQILKDYT